MRDNFYKLPDTLPIPQDDGACSHLEGITIPNITLSSTTNQFRNLADQCQSPTVLFFYPRTGRPDESSPVGWDEIPGARGCTPQSCGYRDLYTEFQHLGFQLFGISTQTTEYHQELIERIHLPFEILSDANFRFTDALRLPTFVFNSMKLLKRMVWIAESGKIVKVFYPVFPPDKSAETVLNYIRSNPFECPVLESERLVLEPITETHTQELWELFNDPDLHRFVPFEPLTLDEQRERFARWAKRRSPDGSEIWLNWAGRDRATKKAIAHFQAGIKADGIASIGYLVAKDFQKKGIATEGLETVFKHLRERFSVKEVKAWSDTRNQASHQLAKKLGMTQVDFIKDADFFKGATSDEFVFSKVFI